MSSMSTQSTGDGCLEEVKRMLEVSYNWLLDFLLLSAFVWKLGFVLLNGKQLPLLRCLLPMVDSCVLTANKQTGISFCNQVSEVKGAKVSIY